jgi:hypothetical protein
MRKESGFDEKIDDLGGDDGDYGNNDGGDI